MIEELSGKPQCEFMSKALIGIFKGKLHDTMPQFYTSYMTLIENSQPIPGLEDIEKTCLTSTAIHILIINFIRNILIPHTAKYLSFQVIIFTKLF